MGLVTEASRKMVSVRRGTAFSRSAMPYAPDDRSRLSVTTAAERPGMPSRSIAARIRASTASIFAGGRPGAADGSGDAAAVEGDGGCASAAPSASAPSAVRKPSLQPVLVLQLLRKVLLGDEADAAPGERFQLELEPALDHLLDLA